MPVKLLITKKTDVELRNQFEFNQDVITIGRDSTNLVYLPDDHKIVGREHAKIERTNEGYHIIDVGSKNFTYLNEKKLDAGKPYPLHEGDEIKCGEFLLTFSIQKILPKSSDETVFLFNPFIEDSESLAQILSQIYEKYILETTAWKEDALKTALHQAFKKVSSNEAGNIISEFLNSGLKTVDIPRTETKSQVQFHQSGAVQNKTIDILVECVVKMLHGYYDFRTSFLGETILTIKKKSPDYLDLHSCTAEEMKHFLMGDQQSNDEANKRHSFVKQALNELMKHQIAILEGYKNCVKKGTQQFLQLIAPQIIKKEVLKRKFKIGPVALSFRAFPFLFNIKFLEFYRQKHKELLNDEESYVEKKVFRPGFIEGYRKIINSLK